MIRRSHPAQEPVDGPDRLVHGALGQHLAGGPAPRPGLDPLLLQHTESHARGDPGQQEAGRVRAQVEQGQDLRG